MANELQVRYSKLVDQKLRNNLVSKDNIIFNNRYEGSPTAGSVKIPVRDEVAVSDYNKATGGAPTSKDTTYITMIIDKDKYVNELIDGYDAAAVPDGIVADRLDSAGYGLANQMDVDAFAELIENGTTVENTTALTKTTVYEAIVNARTALSEANVKNEGRYLVVSPAVFSLLLRSSDFIKASDLGQKLVETGAVGQIAGFTVYESNNMIAEEGTTVEFIAGHPDCATRAQEWAVPVKVVDLDGDANFVGASAVKGRKVYAHKVVKPVGIYVKTAVVAG